jgi:WD40 repeat protein
MQPDFSNFKKGQSGRRLRGSAPSSQAKEQRLQCRWEIRIGRAGTISASHGSTMSGVRSSISGVISPLASLQGDTGDVYNVAWSPDGKTLATALTIRR